MKTALAKAFLPVALTVLGTVLFPNAGSAATPPPATHSPLAGYQIVRLGRAHLNRILLNVTVEGKQGLLVLDTGASYTSLSAGKFSFLQAAGDRKLPTGVPSVVPFNDQKVPVGYARDFHVGQTDLGAVPVGIVPARLFVDMKLRFASDSGLAYDGLLGENILHHFNAIVDCARLILYLNLDPKHKIDAGAGLVAAGWTRVPMTQEHNNFTVECQVGDKAGRLIVDTGSPFVTIDSAALFAAHVSARLTGMSAGLVGTRTDRVGLAQVDKMAIGNYHADGQYVTAQPRLTNYLRHDEGGGHPLLGLLGGDFLSRNNAIIDIGNHSLYLKRSATSGTKP